jgi:hypothetical protein
MLQICSVDLFLVWDLMYVFERGFATGEMFCSFLLLLILMLVAVNVQAIWLVSASFRTSKETGLVGVPKKIPIPVDISRFYFLPSKQQLGFLFSL